MRSLFLLLIWLIPSPILGQTEWTKFKKNPVHLSGGQPSVIQEGDTLKIWFAQGAEDSLGIMVLILYATSSDGIQWTDHPEGMITPGEPGTWDSRVRDTPWVLKDQEGYKLWYTGADHLGPPYDSLTLVIGFASSTDGLHWEFYPQPVLKKGDQDSWDGLWVESPSVLYEGGLYKMWYTGISASGKGEIGYATSSNGIDWAKHPEPVLEVGDEGSWEDHLVGVCSVLKKDTIYEMWYCGISQEDMVDDTIDTVNVGYAVSSNGIDWRKYKKNPVLTTYYPVYDPDSGGPWAPSVLLLGEKYWMWYESRTGIGLARAPMTGVREYLPRGSLFLSVRPNPIHRWAVIDYALERRGWVDLQIYDIRGRSVMTLVQGYQRRGRHTYLLDFEGGISIPTGPYFLSFRNEGHLEVKKVMILGGK